MKRKKIIFHICLILKYVFVLLFPALAIVMHKMSWAYFAVALAEMCLIAFLTHLLCHVKGWLGYLFNSLALLVMNVQFAVLYWGSTFVSTVMLANVDSVNALSGKFFVYGLTIMAVLLFSFLPVAPAFGNKKTAFALGIATVILYIGIIFTGVIEYSPYRAIYTLYQQAERNRRLADAVDEIMSSMENRVENDAEQPQLQMQSKQPMRPQFRRDNEFYSDSVSDYIKKPGDIPENPNVILIFVEGMSQNIIEDPRNIMPNISALQDRSIHFTNYYNHTFATYMGLSGQLYSDYQRELYDANSLVSVQEIFKYYGYGTTFINTEPENEEFSEYLANFGFDELLADKSRVDGMANALSDKAAYEMLFETALKRNECEAPFFLAMYSFGTHMSLNGVYEEFAEGSNILLNRFYDLDVQVGTFLDRFSESDLAENTVIVLTADHATYKDADFVTAFPDYNRKNSDLDRIPLMIYYKGVTPVKYDVNGRNSLDMVPTILDFFDMSAPNYFLGDSLFASESRSFYDTCYESMGNHWCTADGEIRFLSAEEAQKFEKQLAKYYALKFSENRIYEEFEKATHVYAEVNKDNTAVVTELYNADIWDTICYAFWSDEGGQDDLQWLYVEGNHESYMAYDIDLSKCSSDDVYYIHVYGKGEDGEMTFLGETKVYVDNQH